MKLHRYILFLAGASTLLFYSCEKNEVTEITSAPKGAFVRFYNFAAGAPSVNFYVNDAKVTGTSSSTGVEATTGVSFGSIFPANNSYLSVSDLDGAANLRALVPSTAASNPNGVVSAVSGTFITQKYYSMFTSGVYDATSKTAQAFLVEDVLPGIDTSAAYVRFVNTIGGNINGFNLKGVNTTSTAEVVIADVTPYQNGSAFVKVPGGVYNLTSVGNSTPVTTITRKDVSFAKGQVYTIATKGALGTTAAALDLTRNR